MYIIIYYLFWDIIIRFPTISNILNVNFLSEIFEK